MNLNKNIFLEEAEDQIQIIRNAFSDFRQTLFEEEKVKEIFRAVHTIKGSAGIFGFEVIVNFTHKFEDLLDCVREKNFVLSKEQLETLVETVDVIETLIENESMEKQIDSISKQEMIALEESFVVMKNEMIELEKNIIESQEIIIPKVVESVTPIVRKRILAVDDSSMIRNLIDSASSDLGYDIEVAEDGLAGLKQIKEGSFDIIFSDINMPQMGGLEMVENIRKNPNYKFTPIVMLTTEKKEELKAQGKALGVKAWLVKPFNKKKFSMVLEKLLG